MTLNKALWSLTHLRDISEDQTSGRSLSWTKVLPAVGAAIVIDSVDGETVSVEEVVADSPGVRQRLINNNQTDGAKLKIQILKIFF